MKRAYLSCTVIILLFALILMLSGCGPISDEAQIRSVVNGFSNAMSSQNWDKARGYCIYGSSTYNNIADLENAMALLNSTAENVTLVYSFNVSNVTITGEYAIAYGFLTVTITVEGVSQEESGEQTINLQKVDNSWKIY